MVNSTLTTCHHNLKTILSRTFSASIIYVYVTLVTVLAGILEGFLYMCSLYKLNIESIEKPDFTEILNILKDSNCRILL